MSHYLKSKQIEIPGYGFINLNTNPENTEDYFLMAVRKNNKKRNFLFVSQLLGKHIPIKPDVLFEACKKLVTSYARDKALNKHQNENYICKEDTLVIGFAETATAMGHAVFDCFAEKCHYVHTTRNSVNDYEFAFEFEEEHCHAPEQLFFLQKEKWIKEAKEVIIVDDEVTTGKTINNIINQIDKNYPGKSYSIITFLDWRNNENLELYQQFIRERNLDINFYSLVQGNIKNIDVSDNQMEDKEVCLAENYDASKNGWLFHYGNLEPSIQISAENGMSISQKEKLLYKAELIAKQIKPKLSGQKRAILGTGEFMYFPLQCARIFPDTNYFNATTRSPVIANNHPNYGIKKSMNFICPTDPSRNEYLYNSNIMECDEVVLFFENKVPEHQLNSLLSELDKANYKHKHVVFVKNENLN